MLTLQSKPERMAKKSASILSIFTKTVNDLDKVNGECLAEATMRRAEALHLTTEADELEKVVADNKKVTDKLNALLND